ncbi:MAG: hypothetical protein ACFFDB_12960 [Promethearchaeota archaeon]
MLKQKNCDYCGWKFPPNFIQNISNPSKTLFCENCGTEIKNSNDNSEENIDPNQSKAKSRTKAKGKGNSNSKVGRLYDKLRSGKDPVDKVLYDSDFPLIFKENFILVLCRIIYDSLSSLVDISQVRTGQIELSEAPISEIEKDLAPTMNMRIEDEFTAGLQKISRKVFENQLKRLQAKIDRIKRFRNDYKIFLRWLIHTVFQLMTYFDKLENLPKFERTILKDLRSFSKTGSETSGITNYLKINYDLEENQINSKEISKENYIVKIENEFLRNRKIKVEELKSRWDWMDQYPELIVQYIRDLIIPELIRRNVIKEGESPKGVDLQQNGFKDFYKALRNRKIRYTTILKQMGLKPALEFDKWLFLKKDDYGNPLSYEIKIRKALEYLQKEIIPDLIDKGIIKNNETPKQKHLEKNDYGGFMVILLCVNPKVTFNELLRAGRFKLNLDTRKWIFIDFGPGGKVLSRSERILKITNYLKDTVIPNLIEKRIIKPGNIPKYYDLRNHGHVNFLSAIESRGISYNTVLKAIGFRLRHDRKKFDFLKKDEEGKLLDKDQSLVAASNYFINTIIPDLVEKGIIFEGEVPTQSHLEEGGYKSFLNFLINLKHKITYNNLLTYSGLDINYDPNIWGFIDFDENNEKRTREEQIKAFSKFLTKKIIPNLRIKNKIHETHAPTRGQLEQNGYSDFISAYLNREIFYEEIISAAGLKSTETRILSRIGTYLHWVLESLFLKNTRRMGAKSFYEISPSKQSELFSLKKCDNAIIISDNFLKLSDVASAFTEIHQNIKMVTIDYHFGSNLSDIRAKCFRSYQSSSKYLFIISLTLKGPIPTPFSIPFRCNVQVIDVETFLEFFGFKSSSIMKIKRNIKLAKSAMYNAKSLDKLKQQALKALSRIKISLNFSQIELENYLRSKNQLNLLNYSKDQSYKHNFDDIKS